MSLSNSITKLINMEDNNLIFNENFVTIHTIPRIKVSIIL